MLGDVQRTYTNSRSVTQPSDVHVLSQALECTKAGRIWHSILTVIALKLSPLMAITFGHGHMYADLSARSVKEHSVAANPGAATLRKWPRYRIIWAQMFTIRS